MRRKRTMTVNTKILIRPNRNVAVVNHPQPQLDGMEILFQ